MLSKKIGVVIKRTLKSLKKCIFLLTIIYCVFLYSKSEAAEVNSDSLVQETKKEEITKYFTQKLSIVEDFDMQKLSPDDENYMYGEFESEGLYYSPVNNEDWGIRNKENKDISFYGVYLGEPVANFKSVLEKNGWITIYETLYTALIGDKKYAFSLEMDENGNVSSWFVSIAIQANNAQI